MAGLAPAIKVDMKARFHTYRVPLYLIHMEKSIWTFRSKSYTMEIYQKGASSCKKNDIFYGGRKRREALSKNGKEWKDHEA
jgi:hypothetical protein